MSVFIHLEDIEPFNLDEKKLEKVVQTLVDKESFQEGDINIIFCSDEFLLNINKEYLQHDYYTDIITFDYCEDIIVSGDLFISTDRVNDNAKEFNTGFEKELFRVIIHGVLHLIGFKDKSPEEKLKMTDKEDEYLKLV